MLNLAVAGLGIWGQRHVESARRSGRFIVSAAADPDTDRATLVADKLGLTLYSSIEEIISNEEIDAISLATPHTLHAGQIINAAEGGKHVYTEKPFSLNKEDAIKAIKAVENAKIKLALGHDQRHYPVIKRLRQMLSNGDFGKILHVETNLSHNSIAQLYQDEIYGRKKELARKWRLQPKEMPTGPISQFGIHRIDAFMHLFGKIQWVFATNSCQALDPSFTDTLSVMVRFRSGVTGYIGNSVATPLHSSLRIFGTKIWAESNGPNTLEEYRECSLSDLVIFSKGIRKDETFELVDSVSQNFDAFADSIEGKKEFIISKDEIVHNVSVVDAIGESLESGTKVIIAA